MVLTESLSPSRLPVEAATLVDVLRWRASEHPQSLACTFLPDGEDREERLCYGELDRRARSIAAALAGAAGGRALLVYDSGLDYIAAIYGCLYAGVTAVPVYPPDPFRIDRTLPRLCSIVADAGATWLLATEATLDWTRPLFRNVPGLTSSLATDRLCHTGGESTDDSLACDRTAVAAPHDPAILQYTSGSTGTPRGVTITHANLLANLRTIDATLDREGNVAVLWLPVYHDMGLIGGVFQPVYSGRPLVFMSPVSFMQSPVRWLKAISRYRGTVTAAPNFAYELCTRKVSAEDRATLDLSSLLFALNGAEMVRPETLDRFAETFAECGFRREAFYPCYGLAEATLMVAGGTPGRAPVVRSFTADGLEKMQAIPACDGDPAARSLVGCGRAAPGQQIVIADPADGRRLDDGQVGEIWVAGESIGQGYWNRPEESVETFQALLADGTGPFLRTGDFGFFHHGELFVAGRRKDLIIIRGRNFYPHDIEETIWRCHPLLKSDGGAAFSIEVDGEERLAVVQEVLRPRKADLDSLVGLIRSQLMEVHGVAAAAVRLIVAGTLPKTSSGKKQRRACRDLFLAGGLQTLAEWRDDRFSCDAPATDVVAPRTATERKLAAIFGDVLGMDVLDVHANFFDLGGQSLLAGQLAARIRAEFSAEMPLRTLFSKPTIAGLASWLELPEASQGGTLPPVTCADRALPLPLSSSQEQLWFLEQLESEPRYVLTASIHLRGPLDVGALERSLSTIVERHEALRTVFPVHEGRPQQKIARQSTIPLAVIEDRAAPSPDGRRIDLAAGPLFRARLERLSDDEHRLCMTAHHLVCDGWSLAIFLKELSLLYAGEASGRGTRPDEMGLEDVVWQFPDFAAWQRSCLATPQVARQLEYWKGQLAEAQPLDLATDYMPAREGKFRGQAVNWTVDKATTEALAELARREGATLYMVLLAAFQTLLARYTRQHDVCVGSPVSYRPRREFERAIGYFVNTLPLRTDFSSEPTFRELLMRVRDTTLDALANQDAPLQAIVDAVAPRRDAGRSPLFNVMFVFENLPWQATHAGAISFGDIEIDHTRIGNFDLGLVVEQQSEGFRSSLVYNAELLEPETIEHMAAAFRLLLRGIAADSDQPVARLPLVENAGEAADLQPQATASPDIAFLLARQSQATPDSLAVIDGSLTYRELDEQANRLAHYLKALGVGSDVPVAIFLDRSSDLVLAMLAVLKAGGAYVPFDPNDANERLQSMFSDTCPRAVITASQFLDRLPRHEAEEIVLDRDRFDISRHPTTAPPARQELSSESLAYIIYTSGSTGRPKGVEVTRESLSNLATAMADQYEVTSQDRVLQLISPAFDVAAEEIFPALVRGASLVLGPPAAELTGRAILDVCRRQRVTVAHIPPQLWQQCLSEWQPSDESLFDHLRVLVVGGEAPPVEALNRWIELAQGRVRTLHEFGLTETTVTNLVYELPRQIDAWPSGRKLPIGRPVAGAVVLLLDASCQPVPVGAVGELYIGGPGLAKGYHGLAGPTAERFVEIALEPVADRRESSSSTHASGSPASRVCRTGDLARWRADGNLEFLGRIDEQIKLRGLRIEPAEIERALTGHPAIGQAAVVAREAAPGGKRLVAYLVPTNGHVPEREELRAWLRGKLPDSMIPSAFVKLQRLPLNRSHKLDRDALPPPPAETDQRPFAAPSNEIEQALVEIWQQVLRLDRVGVHDNFFELGGDSILTIQVVARAREAGLRFSPRQMFEHQTISELAAAEGTAVVALAEQGLVEGGVPLTPIQQWFLADDPVDPHHFNQAMLLRVDASLDARRLAEALQGLAEHHDALRLRFAREGDGWRQWYGSADGAWPLARFDLTELPASERPRALTSAAEQLQASLDLAQGPLARAAWFEMAPGEARLLLVIHHLVVDALSWTILLEDLSTLWSPPTAGAPARLPPKTSSFKHWAEQLAGYADSIDLRAELAVWAAFADDRSASLPRDFDRKSENLHAMSEVIHVAWDAPQTADLLERANAAYRTQTDEVLLAALAETLAEWAGEGVFIDVEGHGRADLFEDVDLSRTVGWFTAWRPFALRSPELAPGALLRHTKEALRRAPNQGLSYGVLRYLSTDTSVRSLMAALPQAEVSFNYLGRMGDNLSRASEPIGPTCSSRGRRHHLLEINAYVVDGRLQIDWTFNRELHSRETIKRLAANLLVRLASLVSHCLAPDAGGYTPSDFPLAQMTSGELDKISSLLGD
ncbi:MAG TPA: amino acid adenylation domain-containing protein [Pirellulales bacterium]|nr:amino acid adenylation domain-containing protein [Pirellulales bacterium]